MSESTSETRAQAGTTELTESDRYDALKSARRRRAIEVLTSRPAPVHLDALAVAVATREPETNPRDHDAVERVAVSLHHTHLPKLDALDLVEYDRSNHRVERCLIPAKF